MQPYILPFSVPLSFHYTLVNMMIDEFVQNSENFWQLVSTEGLFSQYRFQLKLNQETSNTTRHI